MSTPIKPLADRVVAVREKAAEKTAGGLYLPDNAKEKLSIFTVQAVGPDVKHVKKGDRILYNGYANEITYNNEDILIVKEEDILATL
jgi:chaperonin GroES